MTQEITDALYRNNHCEPTTGLEEKLKQIMEAKKAAEIEKTAPALIQWSFGEGEEGVFVQPTSDSPKVLLVGRGVPWWGMVIARLELRIHSILLSDTRFAPLVSAYFGSRIPVGNIVNQSRCDIIVTRKALEECAVVAVESLPNSTVMASSEMWEKPNIMLILVAHGLKKHRDDWLGLQSWLTLSMILAMRVRKVLEFLSKFKVEELYEGAELGANQCAKNHQTTASLGTWWK
jgi:hypothetical protein